MAVRTGAPEDIALAEKIAADTGIRSDREIPFSGDERDERAERDDADNGLVGDEYPNIRC